MSTFIMATAVITHLCTTADLATISDADYHLRREFTLVGTVTSLARTNNFILADSQGRIQLWHSKTLPNTGDIIKVKGHTGVHGKLREIFSVDSFDKLGKTTIPPPANVSIFDLHSGKFDFAVVRLRGLVTEATVDEIDPAWSYLVIHSGTATTYAFFLNKGRDIDFKQFINAEVDLTGICIPKHGGLRIFIGPHIELRDLSDISVIKPAPDDPFDVPTLKDIHHISPASVSSMGQHRISGLVIACWQRNKFLLQTPDRRIVGVELVSEIDAPACFETIEVTGYPETDLYRINLSRARWRASQKLQSVTFETLDQSPLRLPLEHDVQPRFWPRKHGRFVRIEGTVRNLPASGNSIGQLYLSCGNYLVPVDVSSCPDVVNGLKIGSHIRVDGICVLDVPNWQANATAFPRIRGFFLVVRKAEDIVVLSRPSWWTPGRLLAVIGSLLAALVGIVIWNIALRRVAERRGRELFKAEIGKVGAELRIDERTRLAVDLHDSLAQNLTAVSFQVASAMSARDVAPAAADEHLKNADRMLRSCRTELRRCLWDLRSDTLEEKDFEQAIRTTVEPVQSDATLHVRFNVPRARVSDTTAHAVLNIIRELVSNAVRHGQSQNVWIVGEVAQRQLRFSVRDDGCGFDVTDHPGQDTGHFGLKGINERLQPLDGTLELSSSDRGTRVIVTIHLSRPKDTPS